ncbi:MAG TPA: hypothetical protein VK166_14155 [Chitinophagaceae bacterium]|nr:hypothetical protein [Chitinophagaceae bacterium]
MKVNGESILSVQSGIFSAIRTADDYYSTRQLATSPKIETAENKIVVSNIRYGDTRAPIDETWTFRIEGDDIVLTTERKVLKNITAEDVAFPSVNFKNIQTWDGAFLDYGGLAWFYLFNEKLCTYGVHSGSSVFWNSTTGNGLSIAAKAPGKQVASKFSRSNDDQLVYEIAVSDRDMNYRYDADTKRRRFVRGHTDVWSSFALPAGKYVQTITLAHVNYNEAYNRGKLTGINGKNVTSLLNTIARIGVIDAKLFGGNSWHTPYGPICLHEQYIAQIGLAINDPAYTNGYRQCLENYRDHAINADGRVIARWAYTDEDAMPGTASPLGFYEAQWGYLMDSNPDFVTNVAESYDQHGDLNWVRTFKTSCEKALDFMLNRDSNGNHLVEMKTDSHTQKRGSDWIDIIWASHENAFVNAKLYYALSLWAKIETQLGDEAKATYYSSYASKLKTSFNKPTREGGFWDENNKWYVHWLDKDGSVHGNNLVVPVNFMAIAYGICDDQQRKLAILERVEDQMQKENLFAWPLCMYSYAPGEGNDWQFPFPNYENGDIFLSWGAVGVDAYASYKPELALKYIENILNRYEKDGLAFQRYGRLKQDGLGDDILSGNSLALVGLYKSIYGINPKFNRLYLAPHLPDRVSGTRLNYLFRGEKLIIELDKGRYAVANSRFKILSKEDFGFNASASSLEYFNANSDSYSLRAQLSDPGKLTIEIKEWNHDKYTWEQAATANKGKLVYKLNGLKPSHQYQILIDGRINKKLSSGAHGDVEFSVPIKNNSSSISIQPL